jgi:hypothetical protein
MMTSFTRVLLAPLAAGFLFLAALPAAAVEI